MVTNYDGEQVEIPETLPMLPVRDIVVFPYMIIPLFVGRDSSIKSVEESLARSDRLILLASQKDISDEHPSPDGIYKTGTVAMIMRMRKLPDGRIKILTLLPVIMQHRIIERIDALKIIRIQHMLRTGTMRVGLAKIGLKHRQNRIKN